jgi:hypothetical protein
LGQDRDLNREVLGKEGLGQDRDLNREVLGKESLGQDRNLNREVLRPAQRGEGARRADEGLPFETPAGEAAGAAVFLDSANETPPARVLGGMKNSWIGGQTTERPDDGLALAVHRCEPGAFERLIERFEQPLFGYAHSILENVFDAQEVVQDAMMRAH